MLKQRMKKARISFVLVLFFIYSLIMPLVSYGRVAIVEQGSEDINYVFEPQQDATVPILNFSVEGETGPPLEVHAGEVFGTVLRIRDEDRHGNPQTGVNDLAVFQGYIAYDPDRLEVSDIQPGNQVPGNWTLNIDWEPEQLPDLTGDYPWAAIDPSMIGYVYFSLQSPPGDPVGLTGYGDLLRVIFKALDDAGGSGIFALQGGVFVEYAGSGGPSVAWEGFLTDVNGQAIPVVSQLPPPLGISNHVGIIPDDTMIVAANHHLQTIRSSMGRDFNFEEFSRARERTLRLSFDGGVTWTHLDLEELPAFQVGPFDLTVQLPSGVFFAPGDELQAYFEAWYNDPDTGERIDVLGPLETPVFVVPEILGIPLDLSHTSIGFEIEGVRLSYGDEERDWYSSASPPTMETWTSHGGPTAWQVYLLNAQGQSVWGRSFSPGEPPPWELFIDPTWPEGEYTLFFGAQLHFDYTSTTVAWAAAYMNIRTDWAISPVNGNYYALTEPMRWMEAEAWAREWGGHLVTLRSLEEEQWIKETFGEVEHFWIGFNDIEEEGNWVWSSGEPVVYTNWAEGEPNNCGEPDCHPEDAAIMNWQGDYWNDVCIDSHHRGVVEIVTTTAEILSPRYSGTLVKGDSLRFTGSLSKKQEMEYRWTFCDGRIVSLRSPGFVNFLEAGTKEVTYAFVLDGEELPIKDTRTFEVVDDSLAYPDLRVAGVNIPDNLEVGEPVDITYTVHNIGDAPLAGHTWQDSVYLSDDPYLDTGDRLLASTAVGGEITAGGAYEGILTITLPPVEEGSYYLILSVNDDWSFVERRRLNNELAELVEVSIAPLKDGLAYTGEYAAGRVEQYFRLSIPSGRNLFFTLDAPEGLEIFVRGEHLPNPGIYDYRSGNGRLLVPAASAGTWYVLVRGEYMPESGGFSVKFEAVDLILDDASPTRHVSRLPLELTITGAGFFRPVQVELIGTNGTTYQAEFVEIHSVNRLTAYFSSGMLAVDNYDIRLTGPDTGTAKLRDALEVLAEGEANLDVRLILPTVFGYHELATVYVEYANTGDVPMSAPLLHVTATQSGREGAILTLDKSRRSQGLWTAVMPEGFDNSVQFLASGQTAGILQPGESSRVPIYYVGWQQPWDFTYPPILWDVGVLDESNDISVDWDAKKTGMRPEYVDEDAWEVVWANFTGLAGTTWGDYVKMLSRNAVYLHRQGDRVEDINRLLALAFRQADALSPLPILAGGTDAAVQSPGMPILFHRMYAQPISRRHKLGPLGRGWTHNWQYTLEVRGDGTVVITDMTGTPRIFQSDIRPGRSYVAAPGDRGVLRAVDDGFTLTEPDGLVRAFSAGGKLNYIEDTNGNRIDCEYTGDQLNRLSHSSGKSMTIDYNEAGRVASVIDHYGRRTQYTYSGEHLVAVQAHDGRTTTYTYHTDPGMASRHALAEIRLSDGSRRTFDYDTSGRLAVTARDAGAEEITFTYGSKGRVAATDVLGNTSQFFFDYAGRIIGIENPLGSFVRFDFDELGQLNAVTNPSGLVSTFDYDQRGNLTLVNDTLNRATRFTYTRKFNRLASVTDAGGNLTSYDYDTHGNLVAITYADGSSETWSYDSRGNPIAWVNRRGSNVSYTYDIAGRVISKTFTGGEQANYNYDDRGNLVAAEDENGATIFSYDEHDYLMRIDYPQGSWLEFDYDAAGRRASSLDQTGRRLDYYYDAAGRLERMTGETGAELVRYDYDAAGRLERKTVGNGVYTGYTYDASGQIVSLVNRAPDNTEISRFDYTYDRNGRRITMETGYGTWTYEYDDTGQLIRAVLESTDPEIDDQELIYLYDVLGNRISVTVNGAAEEYAANKLNQYTQVGDRTYTYDADGNLIEESGPNGRTVYTYNDENRLVGVTRGDDNWEYTYDALGNRVAMDKNGAVTHYVIDPIGLGNVVGEYDGEGNLIAHYDHGLGLLSRVDGAGNAAYYTFDALGNVSEFTGAAGAVHNAYAYRPFGEPLRRDLFIPNPFEFVGEWGVMAEGSGLNYMRARFYEPVLGRFMAADPIGVLGGLNFYGYCSQNPVQFIDPMGLRECTSVGSWGEIFQKLYEIQRWRRERYRYHEERARTHAHYAFHDIFSSPVQSIQELLVSVTFASPELIRSEYHNVASVLYVISGVGGIVTDWIPAIYEGLKPNCSLSKDPVKLPDVPAESFTAGDSGSAGAIDPNEKTGPAGYGAANFVAAGQSLAYRVDFENLETATAPAKVVTVTDPLSSDLDWTTFELTEIGFGDELIVIPPGRQHYETVIDYTYTDNDYDFHIEVHVEAWLEDGTLFVNFFTIDPETGLPPQDVDIGFLPPENETGRGQGFVSYLVRPKANLPGGTAIRNIATIQFDFGLSIDTNQVDPLNPDKGTDPDLEALITIDAGPPASRVLNLPETVTGLFQVSWSGEDDEGGSGIDSFDIFVRENDGPWLLWMENTAHTSAYFEGKPGQSYSFYSIATDNVGQREEKPAISEAATLVTIVELIYGDVNGDGVIDVSDVILVMQHILGLAQLDKYQKYVSDVNGDSIINISDVVLIMQRVLGLIAQFPVEE